MRSSTSRRGLLLESALCALGCATLSLFSGCSEERVETTTITDPQATYDKANYVADGSKATIELDAANKKAVITKNSTTTDVTFSGIDINPISLAVGDITGDDLPDLVIVGASTTTSNAAFVLAFKGQQDGTFDDTLSKFEIEQFTLAPGAPIALSNTVKGTTSAGVDPLDLALGGTDTSGATDVHQILIIASVETGFEDDPGDWVRIGDTDTIEIDDILPGEIDAGMFGVQTTGVDEATTGDLWLRFNGEKHWTPYLRTGDKSVMKLPDPTLISEEESAE